jgi:hypothetical protein
MPGAGGLPFLMMNSLVVVLFGRVLFVTSARWIVGIGLVAAVTSIVLVPFFNVNLSTDGLNDPRNRTYLRWTSGAVWLFDGLLQFQFPMPLRLANSVVALAAIGTPAWLHSLIDRQWPMEQPLGRSSGCHGLASY